MVAHVVECNSDTVTGEQTHLHASEITAVSPSEPAAAGALVDVHILQVHVHTNHTPARERKGEGRGEEIRRMGRIDENSWMK